MTDQPLIPDALVKRRDAIDLFAGPGGWDVAARRLGLDVLGFEYDAAACATRAAAGHDTVRGDLAVLNPREYAAPGEIASPPCEGFSLAGKGKAREDSEKLLAGLEACRTRSDVEALIASARSWMKHEGTALVLEPLRWALANTPSWLAWEQVPSVLPLWEACAVILRRIGYSVATGRVHAEQFGVPQARTRAILVARAPWMTRDLGPAALPVPTHSLYHRHKPARLDAGVLPWVTMAEACGWTEADSKPEWCYRRPSTTVVGSFKPQIQAGPGYRKAGDGPRQNAPGSVETTLREASLLQSFPADYPWQGVESKQRQQVGNAVPPLLAEAILRAVLGIPFPKPDMTC